MNDRTPTDAELKLWLARIRTESAKGTPVAETNAIFNEMVARWEATVDPTPETEQEVAARLPKRRDPRKT